MASIGITQINAILLLDRRGERIAVNYYPQHCAGLVPGSDTANLWEDVSRQKALEQKLAKMLDLAQAHDGDQGMRMIDGYVVYYCMEFDFVIVAMGPSTENEVLIANVCTTVRSCLVSITDNIMRKEDVRAKLDSVFLVLDDIVDGGIVMEYDSEVIINRLKGRYGDKADQGGINKGECPALGSWLHLPRAAFGTKRVTQKRRYMLKLIHPEEKHTSKVMQEGLLSSEDALPKSLLCNSVIRKLVYSNTVEAQKLADKVDWEAYKCNVRGVRWHPSGSWYVQFNRRNYEKNFFVNCHCYFRVEEHGFQEAKQKAIAYRKRLEAEYEELQETWQEIDRRRSAERVQKRGHRERALEEEEFLLADSSVD
ncbi:AP2 domain transcription factor AP2IV-1 [Babesia caballi]|uniref:Coatomer subunit zeta n=1 Tax=Babesia caballi TaxID=5871 RepID=A0AAV4LTL5_BABCB|nr:AP2 domain transcription factor AP2IV-1 [Babesia caballi]